MIKDSDLILFIENLLHEHDCVIIPNFGGFVIQSSPISLNEEKNIIYPAKRSIAFNEKLKSDDGFLSNEFSIYKKIDLKQASSIIESFTKFVKLEIQQKSNFTFGKIGIFTLNEEKKLQFSPFIESNFNLNMFGLKEVTISTSSIVSKPQLITPQEIQEIHPKIEEKEFEPTTFISSKNNKRKGVKNSIYAVIVFILAGLSTFLLTEPKVQNFTSSIIPIPTIFKHEESNEIRNVIKTPETHLEKTKVAESIKSNHDTANSNEIPKVSVEVKSNGSIELIAGSFLTKEIAEKGIKELSSKGIDQAYLISKDENQKYYRISIGTVSSMEEGYQKALEFKQKNKIDIWVFDNTK